MGEWEKEKKRKLVLNFEDWWRSWGNSKEKSRENREDEDEDEDEEEEVLMMMISVHSKWVNQKGA